jgi:hypothetical protein
MADELSGPPKKLTVTPEEANTITAPAFEGHIGLEFTETTADRVRAKVPISPVLRQAGGIFHVVQRLGSAPGAGHLTGEHQLF